MVQQGPEYHPNIKEAEGGLYCFLSPTRACGPECMAYTQVPDGADYKDQQWANCMLLVGVHRVGKHVIVLASEIARKARTELAQQVRNQPPPPKPI